MKATVVLYVSACILAEAELGSRKDNAKCQDSHSWCKSVRCDSPAIVDSCPMTCGRCNTIVNCEHGQYWNGSSCEQCWDGMPPEYSGKCPCTITGRWGVNCEHTCNKWCLDGICHPISGECANCPRNRYDQKCDKACDRCGNCTDTPSNCHRTNGTCLCGCNPGFYGHECGHRCNSNCRSKSCNFSGICINGCKEGYFGPKCDKKCGACVDKSCSRIGKCLKGCNSGWHGEECYTLCSNNCEHSNCHQKGTCMECLGGFHGDQCKENCSAGCDTKRCNRDGSCQCRKGYFGHQCRNTCSVNCLNTSCSQTSGECEYGCVLGWFGPTCNTRCPDNCAAGACNRYDGSCLSCRERFRGTYCNMSCPRHCVECDQNASNCMSCEPGYFGNTCEEKCNGCLNGKCEITDGFCIDGCKPNLYGRECQSCHCLMSRCNVTGLCTGCQNGYYGQRCSSTCPPRCDTCDQYTGDCVTCVDGWRGHTCNVSYVRSLRQLVRVLSSCIGVVLFSAVIVAAFIIIRKKVHWIAKGHLSLPVRTDHLVSDDISLQEFSDNGESEQFHYETIPDDSQAGYEELSPSSSRTSGYTALLQSAENARVTED